MAFSSNQGGEVLDQRSGRGCGGNAVGVPDLGNPVGLLAGYFGALCSALGRGKRRGAIILNRFRGVLSRLLLVSVISCSWVLLPSMAVPSLQAQVPNLTFVELFHIEAEEVIQFLREIPGLADFVENGSVRTIANRESSLLITADPPTTEALIRTIRDYENLEVRDRLIQKAITIRYAGIQLVLEALAASKCTN